MKVVKNNYLVTMKDKRFYWNSASKKSKFAEKWGE